VPVLVAAPHGIGGRRWAPLQDEWSAAASRANLPASAVRGIVAGTTGRHWRLGRVRWAVPWRPGPPRIRPGLLDASEPIALLRATWIDAVTEERP